MEFSSIVTASDMADDCVDLLIVGGGINGAGIARDAAGRGLKVVLVEQADLASATSSASTKLIHGGLRYLELFELRLVREALQERERLLAIAPHIIKPMQFVLPHVEGLRPRWQIRMGLFLYDHMGGQHRLPVSRTTRFSDEFQHTLKETILHGFVYSDCWVDDSRLVVLNAMDAANRGAQIRTHTRFHGANASAGRWHAQLIDQSSGEQSTVTARAMVNAAGPWVEDVLRSVPSAHNASQVRLVKGSHIIVPKLYEGDHAFLLQHPDGRVVFTIPYERDFTLIGTTDVPYERDPASVTISREEIDYLCDTVNGYFLRQISADDVKWTYAGVRPLHDDDAANASRVTRDYKLEFADTDHLPPLLSVFGGKITTYRRLAEMALHRLEPFIGNGSENWTADAPLPGGELPHGDFEAFLAGVQRRWPFLPEPMARRLAHAYGTRISDFVAAARSLEDLGTHFGAGLTRAEVDYLRTHEWARTADDILWRRSKLGLHTTPAERQTLRQYLENNKEV
ncbi:MAG TPA: glycerol-3-phosphate dehydrogenase [Povalibacter sp.]|jgi:glycerol-3-phosphate dehydrogenase|nr:glycerol-3-phosphate dehydrogenase [Povalibacter sp.]